MFEILSEVWSNLKANKGRSFLTMFGIMWGIISITILSAMGEGFQRGNETVLRELGKNILIIRNGRTSLQAGGERAGRRIRLELDDVLALKEQSRLLEHIAPELMNGSVMAKSPFNSSTLQMSGVWPIYQEIRTIEVDRRRLMTEMDNDEARRVVIIGYDAAEQLFAERDPIGAEIHLRGIPYTIIGAVRRKDQDSNYTGADNGRLFIPYETMRKDFPLAGNMNTPDSISAIIAAPYDYVVEDTIRFIDERVKMDFREGGPTEDEVRSVLGPKLGFDVNDVEALSIWNTSMETVLFSKIPTGMNEFFISVSVITMLLGGIGVMNIMLIAIKERTREIGIRKALGATARTIQMQFFAEGMILTLLSGAIGLGIAVGLSSLVNMLPLPARFTGMIVTLDTAFLAIGILTLIGVAAAMHPARKAARLPPIEALRSEI